MASTKPIASGASLYAKFRQLYFISFIEGGVVMVTEIAGAKLLTPFFGASLYSWASTLSITLFALMTGYYFGGYVTTKHQLATRNSIFRVFFLSGLSVMIMPPLGTFIMEETISLSFFGGIIISQLFFMFLPIFLMGMISPMIIFQITTKAELSGRSAGNIYALSTCGGILFTLIFGFVIVPEYGITLPVKILGLCVSLMGLFFLLTEKFARKKISLPVILMAVLAALAFYEPGSAYFPPQSNLKLVARSEGLLGELKVIDELTRSPDGSPVYIRKLKTNNVQQNFVFRDLTEQSLLYYVNFTRQLLTFIPKKESALLIGLGAGSLYITLKNHNIRVETVEIDERIYEMGVKYFGMPRHEDHTITDGRYFINVTNKKYDLIIIDVIIGENIPGQLTTLESFQRCYQLLNDDGTFIIEHGGLDGFAKNSFIPSIAKTLNAAGFHVRLFNPLMSKTHGDVLFVATKKEFDIRNIHISDDVLIKGGPIRDYELPLTAFNQKSATILTDDKNRSDILLKSHYLQVRKSIRKELAKIHR